MFKVICNVGNSNVSSNCGLIILQYRGCAAIIVYLNALAKVYLVWYGTSSVMKEVELFPATCLQVAAVKTNIYR